MNIYNVTLKRIEKDKDVFQLVKKGIGCICPFRGPIQIPGQGIDGNIKIDLLPVPCTSDCALFDMVRTDDKANLFDIALSCGPCDYVDVIIQ